MLPKNKSGPGPTQRMRLSLAIAIVSVLAFAGTASAASSEREARRLAQEAQKFYDLSKFEDALKDFAASYELSPKPALLFNMAQCHRMLNNYEKAAFTYRRYLSQVPNAPNAAQVREFIKEMEAKRAEGETAKKSGGAATDDWTAPPASAAPATGAVPPPPPAPVPPPGSVASEQPGAGSGTPNVTAAGDAAAIKVANAEPPIATNTEAPAATTSSGGIPWWVWAGAGVVVAGAAVGGVLIFHPRPPTPSLGTVGSH